MTTTTVQAGVLLLLPLLLADKTVLPDLVVLLVLHSHRPEEEGREDHRSHLLEEEDHSHRQEEDRGHRQEGDRGHRQILINL